MMTMTTTTTMMMMMMMMRRTHHRRDGIDDECNNSQASSTTTTRTMTTTTTTTTTTIHGHEQGYEQGYEHRHGHEYEHGCTFHHSDDIVSQDVRQRLAPTPRRRCHQRGNNVTTQKWRQRPRVDKLVATLTSAARRRRRTKNITDAVTLLGRLPSVVAIVTVIALFCCSQCVDASSSGQTLSSRQQQQQQPQANMWNNGNKEDHGHQQQQQQQQQHHHHQISHSSRELISQGVNKFSNNNGNNNNNHDDDDNDATTVGATTERNGTVALRNEYMKTILNDFNETIASRLNVLPEMSVAAHGKDSAQASQGRDDDNVITLFDELLGSFAGSHHLPQRPVYTNDFAVHIPGGKDIADLIAQKYQFTNEGQIGTLENFYLFRHHRVSKRSLTTSEEHHSALNSEPEVRWMQQQHEKPRHKRDNAFGRFGGSLQSIPSYTHFSKVAYTPIAYQQPSAFQQSYIPREPRIQYRDAGPHLIFPDPLFKEQWYLNGGAKDGLDMNVAPAWQMGYTGKNVVVSILDDGIQTNHPDLAQNYDDRASYDVNDNDTDPTPRNNGDNKHGTRCAGEVAAVAFNSYCGVGVAYNASIGGVRMLDGRVNDVVEAKALSWNPQHIDIYSASWGPEDDGTTVDGPGPLARRAFIFGVTGGRQGKGSIFVWASGNGGRYTDSCNCDGYTNSIFTLSISSATQGGYKPWYLEECSSTLATTYSSGTPGHDKGIATVDMDGLLRSDHICTVEHTGTSASAPLAAGICALALEANPSLTWRDMQYLVVMTSRPEPLQKESGWLTNGVKRKCSHKFGYGLMDAAAMVSLAEQWVTVPPQHICKSDEMKKEGKIDSAVDSVLTTYINVNGCTGTINEVKFLEHVQCRISLRFFPRGNLKIVLTSPMGTNSTLLSGRPRDVVKSNFDEWPFLSVHFWGERPEGDWQLRVINEGSRRVRHTGVLSKWQLILYGTAVDPVRLKSGYVKQQQQQQQHQHRISSSLNSYAYSTESDTLQGAADSGSSFFTMDQFPGYPSFQNLFTGAGSNPEQAIATVDGQMVATPPSHNAAMTAAGNRLILHDNCDPECDARGCFGRGATQCVACKRYRLDNTCVSRCPPRSFPNQNGVCWPCHESCETCAGPGQDSCLQCAPAHLHVIDLAVCLQVCPDGYYENYDNKTCVPCGPHCASCQDRPSFCNTCEHHLVIHENRCYAACPENTYETEDYRCASCHASCATCTGSSESQCVTCRARRFFFEGKCVNACPNGFYSDKKRQECVACSAGCATCANNGFCFACHANWTKNKKARCIVQGSDDCTESEYFDSGRRCRPCHATCASCSGSSDSDCLTCAPNLLLQGGRCVSSCDRDHYTEAGACTKCLHACTECTTRPNCTACSGGLQLQNGECRTTCADGYYRDRGTCAKCYLSCRTCRGPLRDQCIECPSGWQLAGGECHPECPEGFYKTPMGCQKCHYYCKTCHGPGPLACASCPSHYMLSDEGLCVECLSSQYYDAPTESCRPCHASCRSCSAATPYACQSCAPPLHLDATSGRCVPCCPTDVVGDARQQEEPSCCRCDKETGGGCKSASPAGKRRIAALDERQQFASYASAGGAAPAPAASGGHLDTVLTHFRSPFTTITAIAIAGCLLVVTIFAIIFAILQRSSSRLMRQNIRYNRLPHKKPPRAGRSSSMTDLLTAGAETAADDYECAEPDADNGDDDGDNDGHGDDDDVDDDANIDGDDESTDECTLMRLGCRHDDAKDLSNEMIDFYVDEKVDAMGTRPDADQPLPLPLPTPPSSPTLPSSPPALVFRPSGDMKPRVHLAVTKMKRAGVNAHRPSIKHYRLNEIT